MRVNSTVNNQSFDVEVEVNPEHEGRFIATVNGRQVELAIIERKHSSLTLSIDGAVGFFEFHKDKGKIKQTLHKNLTYSTVIRNQQQEQLEQLLEEFGAGMGGAATETTIKAPMPGKILGISVKEGDKIELGEIVLVLEAMKMENEISSTVEGKIKAIHVKVGDTVAAEDLMIEIDPPS